MGLGAAILSWFYCNAGTAHPEKDEQGRAGELSALAKEWLLGF
jgi:hypothetical protein